MMDKGIENIERDPRIDRIAQVSAFFDQKDENGLTNREKVAKNQRVIRRLPTTDISRSYEDAEKNAEESPYPSGVVVENRKLIGFGIHILNEDVYPLQSFEIYLRNCDLVGELDLTDCEDLVFLDVYHNRIRRVDTGLLPKMRIFGVQDNQLEMLDPTGMPACQGIDAGKNRLKTLDVSRNPELVELYINDNRFTEIDLSHNPKLKYFYCQNNHLTSLDARWNPLLRHLNATGNPMKEIRCLAPQREEELPLDLYAGEGGAVGLHFFPVYNAQWKETGEWKQVYEAYPEDGWRFEGWFDRDGSKLSEEEKWEDAYGADRVLWAKFSRVEA